MDLSKRENEMKGGTFRGFIIAASILMARLNPWHVKTNHYPDPLMGDPHSGHYRGKNSQYKGKHGRKRLQMPPCIPGTITYRDWLVRELGYDRRLADGYMYAFLNGYKIKMPMPSDLVSQL